MSIREKESYIEEPLVRMAQIWTKLYYHMAREFVSLGEEGENALRRAIRNFAKDRGETMRNVAESRRLPLTYETQRSDPPQGVHDMPFREICAAAHRYFPQIKAEYSSEGFCPYAEWWKKYPDGPALGRIYCDEFHHALWAAFNPKHRVDMVETITKGDPKCTLVSYVEGDEYDRKRTAAIKEICEKAKGYGFMVDSSEHGDLRKACEKAQSKT